MKDYHVSDIKERMKKFYNQSVVYQDLLADMTHYRRDAVLEQYVYLVNKFGPQQGVFLELGCGTGEAVRQLANEGREIIGVDISMRLLKTKEASIDEESPNFVVADITHLPFQNRSVSCVALHEVIEHIPDVNELLDEILRVLSADGCVIIISPNLISPIKPIRHILGIEGFNTKFYGSYLKAIWAIFSNLALIFNKLLSSQPKFTYRSPILDDFQCPDDDAVYMSNFIDFKKWFISKGFVVFYSPFMLWNDSFLNQLKLKILKWFPWLDKGFCLVAERTEQSTL
jgi:ubiquinone/menaquinone biosynthesis C-methylase UbiE